MTQLGSNGASGTRVTFPEVVRQSLLQMHASLTAPDARRRLREAYRSIYSRLSIDPFGFGEPKYRLESLHLAVRLGVVSPLVVSYAVHEERPLDFVRAFSLLSSASH
jgi:hypothetical protein